MNKIWEFWFEQLTLSNFPPVTVFLEIDEQDLKILIWTARALISPLWQYF